MTAATPTQEIPTVDAVHRFMRRNPASSWEILMEVTGIGGEGTAKVSGGRLRELWKLAGGVVDKRGRAWVEAKYLPDLLRKIVDAIEKIES